ncbi:hypothetical protein H8356DRAFT_74014 [Neocallimastix lanati (nom. inval.)]|jgi:hypothetical protein|uniref:DUF4112 domain-containing protein n=1 Tax=Neocallimastix californiae TaxID=1754190 RepID=A0A1Y2BSI5_9FUNG|nr:hypothetical protein H8356DRAFT_74014 [Neocallimastix sp. JGI-2020a]ORY37710.1 hypothetical protein LY90DRAFT_53125 [Neocallimastix californiae]|eukprot:ORY37710.1 hypothetical protein LY90DRAFT_53125 [Neocallimastix californiae]
MTKNNETPYIPESSIPPMPSSSNPIHLHKNDRLKKMYLKDDHVYLSDSDFSDEEEDIEFPYNTTISKHHKNGVLDNFIGKKKTITFVMPKKDAKVLRRAKKYAKRLDSGVSIGGGVKIPLDPIIGILPVVGDFAGIFCGIGFIAIAQKAGLSKKVYSKLVGNLVVDSLVGAIPALGDVADFFHKANLKNYKVLEKYLIKRSKDFTKMINGDLEPEVFYRKYKSFVSHHKKDVYYIHEKLGIPLPHSLETNADDPLPGFVGDEEELQEIENTDGLYVVSSDKPNATTTGECSSKPNKQDVVITEIETSGANDKKEDKKRK